MNEWPALTPLNGAMILRVATHLWPTQQSSSSSPARITLGNSLSYWHWLVPSRDYFWTMSPPYLRGLNWQGFSTHSEQKILKARTRLLFFHAPDVNETHTPGPKGLDLTRLLPGRMVTDQIEPCITCRLRPIDVSRSENTPASASLPTSIRKLKSPDKIRDSGDKIIDSR